MAVEEKTAQEELKEAVWTWVQRLVVAAVLFGGGVVAAYFAWGDAATLRQENKELQDTIVDLKNQRETLNTRIAREARDKEVCQRDFRKFRAEQEQAAPGGGEDEGDDATE